MFWRLDAVLGLKEVVAYKAVVFRGCSKGLPKRGTFENTLPSMRRRCVCALWGLGVCNCFSVMFWVLNFKFPQ